MNDIRPPRQNTPQPSPPSVDTGKQNEIPHGEPTVPVELPALDLSQATPHSLEYKPSRHIVRKVFIVLLALIALLAAVSLVAYETSLAPRTKSDQAKSVRVTVDEGMSPSSIADLLEENQLIRSAFAFRIYSKIHQLGNRLQAGTYSLSSSMSSKDIAKALTSGSTESLTVTFLPGATVAQDKKVLLDAGYSAAEIDAAFSKQYNHPLFMTKPASADLEGYIYGETYKFSASATVEDILTTTFDEFYAVIKADKLTEGFKSQGLSLYQGITLASIIQREVNTPTDMRQVAQVFLLRLKDDISLGSDVTYQYAADKMGVARDPSLASPYNTRVVKGLPPGPISAPGKSALDAVANPAAGDYVFFLSGDDDKTYFARTQAEHEKNIADHCQKKCQIL